MASTLLDLLVAMDGRLPAVDDGTLRLSYADVQRSVASERRWLQSLGVRRCALLAENSARWVLSDLALLANEAVNIPLLPSLTREQTSQVLAETEAEWILTDQAEAVLRDHPAFTYVGTSHRTGLSLLRQEVDASRVWTADTSKVTYEVDSSGGLKGLRLKQRTIRTVTDSLLAATARLGVQTHLCILPLANLLENIAGVYVPLMMGGKVIVRPRHTIGVSYSGSNVSLLLKTIDAAAPDSMILVPGLLDALVHALRQGWRAPASLKFIAVGDDVSVDLLQAAGRAGLPIFRVHLGDLDTNPNVTVS